MFSNVQHVCLSLHFCETRQHSEQIMIKRYNLLRLKLFFSFHSKQKSKPLWAKCKILHVLLSSLIADGSLSVFEVEVE